MLNGHNWTSYVAVKNKLLIHFLRFIVDEIVYHWKFA